MLRVLLFLPAMVYFALVLAFLARQIAGGGDHDTLRMVTACAGSFLIYHGIGFVAASFLGLTARGRLGVAYGLPCVLFLALAALDFFDKGPRSSGGFISLNFNAKTLWVIPGVFLNRPLQWQAAEIPATPPQLVACVEAALPEPDRSLVLVGVLHEKGVRADWRVLARLGAAGNVDRQAPAATLPDFDAIRARPDGSALVSWRREGKNVVGSLNARGEVTTLFELSPAAEIFPNESEHITDLAMDSHGRLLLAGRFEKAPPSGEAFAGTNYRVVRLDGQGRMDRAFSLTPSPRFFNENIRLATTADGGIVLAYESRLDRLSADGKPRDGAALPAKAADLFVHPDGSVHVAVAGPALARFDAHLQPDDAFQARTAKLAEGFLQMRILAAREDGGVIVSLYSEAKSRLVYLAKDGTPAKTVDF